MTRLSGWRQRWRDWEPNPVLVKEARQAVRSNLFLGVEVLLLLALSGGSLILLALVADRVGDPSREAGMAQLVMVGVMLSIALGVAALALLARSQQGPGGGSQDLLLITRLSPGAIVRGRILSGLCAVSIILSAGMPFLTIAYLLRGVSLATILWVAGGLLALGLLLTAWAALAAACTGPDRSRMAVALFTIIPIAAGPPLLAGATRFFGRWMPGGIPPGVATVLGLLLVTALLAMYAVAVFMLSPRNLNRALPCRLVLSGLFLGWWLLTPVLVLVLRNEDWARVALVVLAVLTAVGFVTALLAAGPLSRRVRQEIPRGRLGRFLALFVFNGTLPAAVWLVAALALLVLWDLMPAILEALPPTVSLPGVGPVAGVVAGWSDWCFVPFSGMLLATGYLLLYLLMAIWLAGRLQRFPQFQRGESLLGLVGACLAIGTQVPWLTGFAILGANAFDGGSFPLLGSLVAAFSSDQYEIYADVHAAFLVAMLLLFGFLNVRWLAEARREFRRWDGDAGSAEPAGEPVAVRTEVPP